jgi:cobalamin biosynthesis Mg chelatase CobN
MINQYIGQEQAYSPPNYFFEQSYSKNLIAQVAAQKVSGNIKVKWSFDVYTAIVKQEVYIAKSGNAFSLIGTFNEGTTTSMVLNTREYSDGNYTIKIKAFLDDGETFEQNAGPYEFSNPVVSSSTTTTSTSTASSSVSTSSSTTVATTTSKNSTNTSTNTSTSTTTSSSSVSTSSTSESSSNSINILNAVISDLKPTDDSKVKFKDFEISGKIVLPEGKEFLVGSLKIFLAEVDISSMCTVDNLAFKCNVSESSVVKEQKTGVYNLEIAYSDQTPTIYSKTLKFELENDQVSSSSSATSKISSIDEEKVFILFGRKVPAFILYGFIAIAAILLLVFAIPWILFIISERKMSNKVKKLATI